MSPGRLPHFRFRGLQSVYHRYGLHDRQVAFATLYIGGFSSFVASTAAPIATGVERSSSRVGFTPTADQRLSQRTTFPGWMDDEPRLGGRCQGSTTAERGARSAALTQAGPRLRCCYPGNVCLGLDYMPIPNP
jgi:hypothetical protein